MVFYKLENMSITKNIEHIYISSTKGRLRETAWMQSQSSS